MRHLDDKVDVVDGVAYRYTTSWVDALETEEHWRLYWQQQKMMQGLVSPGQHVLEIGLGTGFTADYLRTKGVVVTTIDIDAEKRPDIVANIVTYDFCDRFDHVLGFEVFEHIPFRQFTNVLERLVCACKGHLFASVPRNERVWLRCSLTLPRLGHRSFEIATLKKSITTAHHFWEVGHDGITLGRLERAFSRAGFSVERRRKAFSRYFYTLRSSGAGQ